MVKETESQPPKNNLIGKLNHLENGKYLKIDYKIQLKL